MAEFGGSALGLEVDYNTLRPLPLPGNHISQIAVDGCVVLHGDGGLRWLVGSLVVSTEEGKVQEATVPKLWLGGIKSITVWKPCATR